MKNPDDSTKHILFELVTKNQSYKYPIDDCFELI